MSGIGKGVATASIAQILKSKGFSVTAIKIDPYINVDAGTMNPVEHGEVFVTKDGLECDQDVGNYERFLEEDLTTDNCLTTGRVYQTVIERERNLGYGGRCVEVVPDIPNEVISRLKRVARKTKADFALVEIGGTVGEYQNVLFLEAGRMLKLRHPKEVLFILISYLPIPIIGEMKTKPTQQATRWLNMAGIQPDLILARSQESLDNPRKRKLSIFCNLTEKDIISAPDIDSIYEVPFNFEREGLGNKILKKFGLSPKKSNLRDWANFVRRIKNPEKSLKIGIVGKYFKSGGFVLMDSYVSVIEAIKHTLWFYNLKPEISWLSAENYERNPEALSELKKYDGIVVPGGFGSRGVEGKILAIEFCRKNKIPFLGLCLGMQLACIEFARNVCGLRDAHSTEFCPKSAEPVIDVMPEQKALLREKKYGATMRLGEYLCKIYAGTKSYKFYSNDGSKGFVLQKKKDHLLVSERHRHRYELNNQFREILAQKGLIFAGINPERDLVEIIEIKDHPFFVATQFHPEFRSRPLRPHPLFREFARACLK